MAKTKRILIQLRSNSGHFYTTKKNKKNTLCKIKLKKFDPFIRRHNIYKEHKLKK